MRDREHGFQHPNRGGAASRQRSNLPHPADRDQQGTVVCKHTPNGTRHCPHTSAPRTPRGVTAADPGEEGHKRGTRTQSGRSRSGGDETPGKAEEKGKSAQHGRGGRLPLTTRGLRSTTETPRGIWGRRLAPDDTRTPCGRARGSAGDSRSWPTGPLRHKPPLHRASSDRGRGRRAARTDKIDSPWPTGPPRTREGTSGTMGKHHHGIKPPHTRAILTPFPTWDANRPLAPPRSPLTGPGPPPPWVPKQNRQHPQHQAHMPGISIPSTTQSRSGTGTHPDLGFSRAHTARTVTAHTAPSLLPAAPRHASRQMTTHPAFKRRPPHNAEDAAFITVKHSRDSGKRGPQQASGAPSPPCGPADASTLRQRRGSRAYTGMKPNATAALPLHRRGGPLESSTPRHTPLRIARGDLHPGRMTPHHPRGTPHQTTHRRAQGQPRGCDKGLTSLARCNTFHGLHFSA
ncbi:hypothetical protein P7K49_039418 [Saguinus oedipus]|uniref:Uncharacterized protein n=1 Tax=Saguinus oedipus TaxID=9490 RepID=A0ABQ9TCP0_SAGOE|nr:hypothetical protein P7K49_039418 [Saguinus oedipus]